MNSRLLCALTTLAVAVLIESCQKPTQREMDVSPGAAPPKGALRVARTPISNLKITFNGAIAFVPEDSTDPTKYARVTALAVRADGVDQNGDFRNQYLANIAKRFNAATPPIPPIPPHYAYLRVKANNYCADTSVPCQPSSTAGKDDYIYIPLVSDDIQIAPLVPPSPPGILKAGSLDNSANLADYSSHGQVCSGCLDDKPNPSDVVERVAARLRFSAGTLTPDPDPANQLVCDWHFLYLDNNGKQHDTAKTLPKLYQRLMLSAQLPGSEVTVNVVPFKTSPIRPTFAFKLAPVAGGNDVNMELLDMPATDIMDLSDGYAYNEKWITHFLLLYALDRNVGGTDDTYPFPAIVNCPHPAPSSPTRGGNPYCSHGTLNP